MRKKISIILVVIVSAFFLFGCTVLPASQETGVGPEEYASIRNAEKIKEENENLKKELDKLKIDMEEIKKDYLKLTKDNETVVSKLEKAENTLEILESNEVPKFNSEKTDKNSIVTYLNDSKSVLNKNQRGIEIIEGYDDKVLFYTTGYGDSQNQIFVWKIGESEPILINEAVFSKDGSFEKINNKFLLIVTGNDYEQKILDLESESIISKFYSKQDIYLLPGTATYIIQRPDTGILSLYDFINSKEQEIRLDYNNKYTHYEKDGEAIIFTGSYSDEETQYFVQASMDIDKMKEKYNIATLEETIELKENKMITDETNESIEIIETEGTL